MNKVILVGRLTRDPEMRYSKDGNTAIARFSLAVDRRFKREGDPDADFFNLVSFGKTAEFVDKYLHQGTKIVVDGEIRQNNYTNKEGRKVYSYEILANVIEFAESKAASERRESGGGYKSGHGSKKEQELDLDGFMNVEDLDFEGLPF